MRTLCCVVDGGYSSSSPLTLLCVSLSRYLGLSLVGTFFNPFVLCLELFAVARRAPVFNEVLTAITRNPGRLVSTVALTVMIIWIFEIIVSQPLPHTSSVHVILCVIHVSQRNTCKLNNQYQ